ncbi:MAG: redoxin domain-containing protein [Candidatus Obscuribacterales bacterium]|nr:redoxin domain-containing protein [Steroidobacteraceae bacterium]
MGIALTGCSGGTAANDQSQTGPRSAPEFVGITRWLNSEPLTMQALKGKVVLVEFWTRDCSNCLRALPHVTQWYNAYKDQGLVVVGVHTPEFSSEYETVNVKATIEQLGIHFPVAQDNQYATWNAYRNQFWPASYLIDRRGMIVYKHFGEGRYDETENMIRKLIAM